MDAADVNRVYHIIKQANILVNPRTEEAATRLLLGTCAVESGFRYRRQIGFEDYEEGGAFGLFQTEISAVEETIKRVKRNRTLLDRLSISFIPDILGIPFWDCDPIESCICVKDESGDWLAALLARLHYLWVPESIPSKSQELAEYWLSHYNKYGSLKPLVRKGATLPEAEAACKAKFVNGLHTALQVVDTRPDI